MLSSFSSVGIRTPPPPGVPSPPLWSGGEGTLAGGKGVGGVPIPTRGHTLWCSVYVSTLCATALSYLSVNEYGGASHAQMPRAPLSRQVSRQRRLSSRVISYHNVVNRSQVACLNTHYLCSVELAKVCRRPHNLLYTMNKFRCFDKRYYLFIPKKILKHSVRTFFAY